MRVEGSKREERPRGRSRRASKAGKDFILNKIEKNRIDLFHAFHSNKVGNHWRVWNKGMK